MVLILVLLLTGALAEMPGPRPMERPDLFEGDIVLKTSLGRNIVPGSYRRWPGGRIPYVIDNSLMTVKPLILKAMEDYHGKTCLRFVPRTNQNDYVLITRLDGCWSSIGRIGGRQKLSLGYGCDYFGTVVHELGHAIGFYHEHSRSDRDDYLEIFWQNIRSDGKRQFRKLSASGNIIYNGFDYYSIMLYGEKTYSKDGYSKTMQARNGVKLLDVPYKPGLTKSDANRINLMYQCREYSKK